MHLTKHQEAAESTRIEFERMSAELSKVLEKLERSENEKEMLKQNFAKQHDKNPMQDKQYANLEAEARQLVTERWVFEGIWRIFDWFWDFFVQRSINYATREESGDVDALPERIVQLWSWD